MVSIYVQTCDIYGLTKLRIISMANEIKDKKYMKEHVKYIISRTLTTEKQAISTAETPPKMANAKKQP